MKNELQPTSKDLLLSELNKLSRPDWWESPWVFWAAVGLLLALVVGTGAGSQVLDAANAQGERRAERTQQHQNIQEAELSLEDMKRLDSVARARMHAAEMPVANRDRSKYARITEGVQLLDPETGAPLVNRTMIDTGGMTAVTDANGYPTQLAPVMWKEGERLAWLRTRLSDDEYAAVESNTAVQFNGDTE